MTDVEFEEMLSTKPYIKHTDCIRDLIFNNYLSLHDGDVEKADKATREYTDSLYSKLVHRKA